MKHSAKFLACILALALILGLGCTALALTDDDVIGTWESYDYYYWYVFTDDGRWAIYFNQEPFYGLGADGYYDVKGSMVYLYLPNGSLDDYAYLDGDDLVIGSSGDSYYASSLPDISDSDLVQIGAAGTWESPDTDSWIIIYPDGMYVTYDSVSYGELGYVRTNGDNTVVLLENYDDAYSDALLSLTLTDENTAEDGSGVTYTRGNLPFDHHSLMDLDPDAPVEDEPAEEPEPDPVSLGGTWEYDDFDAALEIDETAGTFRMYNDAGSELSGTLAGPDEDGSISLVTDTQTKTFTLTDENTLTDWEGDTLTRAGR